MNNLVVCAQELEIFEMMKRHSPLHPNIVPYYGYVTSKHDPQRIEGLALKKLPFDLFQAVRKNFEFDRQKMYDTIESVVHYLHTEFSLVHNDLHPGNIMLDENYKPYLIDFGHTFPNGTTKPLYLPGTPHWTNREAEEAKFENDELSLKHINRFVFTGKTPTQTW